MIVCRIFLLALFVSVSSSYRFPRIHNGRSRLLSMRVDPARAAPIKVNDQVVSRDSQYNTMIRRGREFDLATRDKPRKVKDYDVKATGLDTLKSLQLDDTLQDVLTLDTQVDKKLNGKQIVGFKVVNVEDLDHDRLRSKRSHHQKVKLIQSLAPPQKFYQKLMVPTREVLKQNSAEDILNSDILANKYLSKSIKPRTKAKSIFDKNGMLFLTKPQNAEERKLSALINKVLRYKESQGKQGVLRQPEKAFTRDEIKQIELIAKAIDEEGREDDEDEIENNLLDKLLLREQLQGERNQAQAQRKNIKLNLSQALKLLEDYDENQERDDEDKTLESNEYRTILARDDDDSDDDDNDQVQERYDKTRYRDINDKPREIYIDDETHDREADLYKDMAEAIADAIDQKRKHDYQDQTMQVVDLPWKGSQRVRLVLNHDNNEEQLKKIARAVRTAQKMPEDPSADIQKFDFADLVS